MEEFGPLDVVLLISGCKIRTPGIGLKILNFTMALCIVGNYAWTFYYSLGSSLRTGGVLYLTVMERYMQTVCGLFFMFTMNWNSGEIIELLTDTDRTLTPKQKSSLFRHSFFSMLVIFATVAQDVGSSISHLLYCVYEVDLGHIALDMGRSYYNFNSWFMGGCLVYAYFVKVIQFTDENYFNSLHANQQDIVPENTARLALERRKVMMARNRLLKTFSLIPCLWFIFTFIKGPCLVLQLSHWFHLPIEKVWRLAPLVYQIIVVGYLVFLCDSSSNFTRKKVDELIVKMMSDNTICSMDVFVTELERSGEQQFTVWKTLVINRKFFLTFISSLVAFTVFFIEITKEVLKDSSKPTGRQTRLINSLE